MPTVSIASKGKLVTPSKFSGYDFGMNPYVGCQIGCSYCYVRFFVQDEQPWGDFVRLRNHISQNLPKELNAISGKRLVLGTMTDPYQPIERKERLTRRTLELIASMPKPLAKVGIFTRSPIALDDIELIKRMPNPRVHITIGPFPRHIMEKIEPIAIDIKARAHMAKQFKEAGVQVWINVSAALPVVSEPEIERTADMLADIKPDGFYVDCMQPYTNSLDATLGALDGTEEWPIIRAVLSNPKEYKAWQNQYRTAWETAWAKRANATSNTMPLWSNHKDRNRYDLRTGAAVSRDDE